MITEGYSMPFESLGSQAQNCLVTPENSYQVLADHRNQSVSAHQGLESAVIGFLDSENQMTHSPFNDFFSCGDVRFEPT